MQKSQRQNRLTQTSAFPLPDPEEFVRNMLKCSRKAARSWTAMLDRADNEETSPTSRSNELSEDGRLMTELSQHWMSDPVQLAEAQAELMRNYVETLEQYDEPHAGQDAPKPVAEPERRRQPLQGPGLVGRTPISISGSRPISSPRHWAEKMLPRPKASTSARSSRPSSTCGRCPAPCRRRISR